MKGKFSGGKGVTAHKKLHAQVFAFAKERTSEDASLNFHRVVFSRSDYARSFVAFEFVKETRKIRRLKLIIEFCGIFSALFFTAYFK